MDTDRMIGRGESLAALEASWKQFLETKNELGEHVDRLEEWLASIRDGAQLANIELQNALQKQAQLLATISNISKALHDSAMAVIRNMK